MYDASVASPSAALAALMTQNNPRDTGSPSAAPAADSASAPSSTAITGAADDSPTNCGLGGDARSIYAASVGFEAAISNEGSFTDWLKSLEIYGLIEHLLDKNFDCWDFTNRKIEGLLLVKVKHVQTMAPYHPWPSCSLFFAAHTGTLRLASPDGPNRFLVVFHYVSGSYTQALYHRFVREKQEIRRRELMPKGRHRPVPVSRDAHKLRVQRSLGGNRKESRGVARRCRCEREVAGLAAWRSARVRTSPFPIPACCAPEKRKESRPQSPLVRRGRTVGARRNKRVRVATDKGQCGVPAVVSEQRRCLTVMFPS